MENLKEYLDEYFVIELNEKKKNEILLKKDLYRIITEKEESGVVSSATISVYKNKFKLLDEFENFPFYRSLEDVLDFIIKTSPTEKINTIAQTCNVLFVFARNSDLFKEDLGGEAIVSKLMKLKNHLDTLSKTEQSQQRENDIDFQKLLDLEPHIDKLNKQEQLIYKLYVNPRLDGFYPRNDFANMKIVREVGYNGEDNYADFDNMTFNINEFKSSKYHQLPPLEIPVDIYELIEGNEEFVFEYKRGQHILPITDSALGKKIVHTFQKLDKDIGRVSINVLRRSYAKYKQTNDLVEKKNLAEEMTHSIEQHINYESQNIQTKPEKKIKKKKEKQCLIIDI